MKKKKKQNLKIKYVFCPDEIIYAKSAELFSDILAQFWERKAGHFLSSEEKKSTRVSSLE